MCFKHSRAYAHLITLLALFWQKRLITCIWTNTIQYIYWHKHRMFWPMHTYRIFKIYTNIFLKNLIVKLLFKIFSCHGVLEVTQFVSFRRSWHNTLIKLPMTSTENEYRILKCPLSWYNQELGTWNVRLYSRIGLNTVSFYPMRYFNTRWLLYWLSNTFVYSLNMLN